MQTLDVDWEFWKKIDMVELWQAILLSCDLNPNNPDLEDCIYAEEPANRLKLLNSHLNNVGYFSTYEQKASNPHSGRIHLSEFVKWASVFDMPMPFEMQELASAYRDANGIDVADSQSPFRASAQIQASIKAARGKSTNPDNPTDEANNVEISRNQVIVKFCVKSDPDENFKFWDDKLGRPPAWLIAARTYEGSPGRNNPSRWNPLLLAHALLSRNGKAIKYIALHELDLMFRKEFPELFARWKIETEDLRN
jgi:hypothetical protein